MVGDMLASGGSVYERDDDIELVGQALPSSLKLVESLLLESPDNGDLLLTASRGYVLYAYAYVHHEAELAGLVDIDRARALRARARKLYLRAFSYAVHALDRNYPGFGEMLKNNPREAVSRVAAANTDRDLPFLYYSAAALGLAISVSKSEPAMLARLPEVDALLDHALALDEDWNNGALHEFEITWAAARRTGADEAVLRRHYARALELSRGERASLFVAMAEAVSLPHQDREEFQALLGKALSVDPDADPDNRLMNAISQRRASWLLNRIDELIL
jgi:predicted anti-sigma-YlaC factor YlaD